MLVMYKIIIKTDTINIFMRIYVSLICFYMYTGYNGTIKRNVYGLYFSGKTKWKESTEMSQTTITLLFLVFTIISFILEKFLLV